MAVNLYAGFTNVITGETFRCVSYNEEAFIVDWTVQPGGYVPFEHIHLAQDEVFHVKSGELRLLLEGQEYLGKPGDTLVVPKGKRHVAFNNKPELLNCTLEYKPGLDNYKFFQCFGGLTLDQDLDRKGEINIPKMLYFAKRMKVRATTRPTSIPAPLIKLAANVFFVVGSVLGWRKLYHKYTGDH